MNQSITKGFSCPTCRTPLYCCCHDEYLLASLLAGADGALVGFAGFVPELIVDLVHAALSGDYERAYATQEVVYRLNKAVYRFGEPSLLCRPQASSLGDHWNGPFPYADGPIAVYAPQHTHPHPSFFPDGRHVIYTSDVSGHAQVYEATLPA